MKKRKSPAEQLMEAVMRHRKKPPAQRFQELIDRGAINEKGEVLLRYPKPPAKPRKTKVEKSD